MRTSYRRLGRWLLARRKGRARWGFLLGCTAVTAALLAVYASVEAPWFALGFIALVPWLFALDSTASLIEAAGAGVAMSVVLIASVFSWFPEAAGRYSQSSPVLLWLLLLLAAPLLQPQLVVFAMVRHAARGAGLRWPAFRAALAAACAYVGIELLVPKLFFDTLGQGLYPSSYLRQAADIAGVHGLTLFVLLVNEGVCATLQRAARASVKGASVVDEAVSRAALGGDGSWWSRAGRILSPLAGAIALVLAVLAYGYLRYSQVEASSSEPGHVIGVVQANVTNYDKLRAEKGAFETVRTILDAHVELSDEIRERADPDLIIWPETVYPTTFGSPKSEAGAAFDEEITAFPARSGVPLVFGAYDSDGRQEFNAAFFLQAAPGERNSTSVYRKRMLFPLTERVPEWMDSDWLRSEMPWTGRWERGAGPSVIQLKLRGGSSTSIVPLICYDALFPDIAADAAQMGADMIVTLSNDSWFPDERAPKLHLISAAFRSVETRLPQVRATNSGISAMIAPTGEITARTRWNAREILVASLSGTPRKLTFAVAWRKWLGPVMALVALVLLLQGAVRGRQTIKARPRRSIPQSKRRART